MNFSTSFTPSGGLTITTCGTCLSIRYKYLKQLHFNGFVADFEIINKHITSTIQRSSLLENIIIMSTKRTSIQRMTNLAKPWSVCI